MKRVYSSREFERLLKNNGWVYDHQTGDHRLWYKNGRHISVPLKKLNRMVARRLVKENRLEVH